jgi:hypothetical protein
MNTPSSPALFGFILLVLAGVFVVSTRHDRAPGQGNSQASVGHRHPEMPTRGSTPANSSASIKQSQEEKPPLLLTEEGLVDFSNYDRNGDGDPEIEAFLVVYRRVDTSAGRIDMLDNVRTFDTLDQPQLNDLLIEQAAKAEDAEVRRAAREALFEHGGAKAHEALAAYLESETRAADRQKLEKLLGDLQRPSLSQVRSRSKNPTTVPSPPGTNN